MLCMSAVAIAPAIVNAGTQYANGACASNDNNKILLWENKIGFTNDNNDNMWVCTSHTNLDAVSHTLPGNCESQVAIGGSLTWDTCVSSFTAWVASGYTLCFFRTEAYGGHDGTGYMTYVVGPQVADRRDFTNINFNDVLQSFKWVLGGPTNCY